MKKILLALLLLITTALMAQPPQSFMYQSILRNSHGNTLGYQRITAKVSILKSSTTGTAVFEETHSVTSDAFGVITLPIGEGTAVSGNFANIDWFADDYFLKTEIDPIGSNNYSLSTTIQLLSVPFALVSNKTNELVGINNMLDTLDNRIRQIDSLINVYSIMIRNFNDSIQTLNSSPGLSPAQIDILTQNKIKIEATLNTLRYRLSATRNLPIDNKQKQQPATITISAGHRCDR